MLINNIDILKKFIGFKCEDKIIKEEDFNSEEFRFNCKKFRLYICNPYYVNISIHTLGIGLAKDAFEFALYVLEKRKYISETMFLDVIDLLISDNIDKINDKIEYLSLLS